MDNEELKIEYHQTPVPNSIINFSDGLNKQKTTVTPNRREAIAIFKHAANIVSKPLRHRKNQQTM